MRTFLFKKNEILKSCFSKILLRMFSHFFINTFMRGEKKAKIT